MTTIASQSAKVRPATSVEARPAALSTVEAAMYIGLAHTTLKKWRVTGDGPSYVKAGSRIVYLIDDLDAWLYAHRVK